jgi:hypothetical protein
MSVGEKWFNPNSTKNISVSVLTEQKKRLVAERNRILYEVRFHFNGEIRKINAAINTLKK